MLRHDSAAVGHPDFHDGHQFRPTALLASLGASCAHHIRDAAPHLFTVLHRTSAVPGDHPTTDQAPTAPGAAVCVSEWDTGRWFVSSDQLGMLGEIERAGCCYLVSHSTDARGASFRFRTLQLATWYFEEYAAALTLGGMTGPYSDSA